MSTYDPMAGRLFYASERLLDRRLDQLRASRGEWSLDQVGVSAGMATATVARKPDAGLSARVRSVTEGFATQIGAPWEDRDLIRGTFAMRWGVMVTWMGSYRFAWMNGFAQGPSGPIAVVLCGTLSNYLDYSGPRDVPEDNRNWFPSSAQGFEELARTMSAGADDEAIACGIPTPSGPARKIHDFLHYSEILAPRMWAAHGVVETLVEVFHRSMPGDPDNRGYAYGLIGAPIWARETRWPKVVMPTPAQRRWLRRRCAKRVKGFTAQPLALPSIERKVHGAEPGSLIYVPPVVGGPHS